MNTRMDDYKFSMVLVTIALIQGLYYLGSGLLSLIDIQTFQQITGPKTDLWLVQTVGVLVCVIGLVLISAAFRRRFTMEIFFLGVGSALSLIAIEFYYTSIDRIASIYLIDAFVQVAFATVWIISAASRFKYVLTTSLKSRRERTAENVLDDHLSKAQRGEVDADIQVNYDPRVVLLTGEGIYQGHLGVQKAAERLKTELGNDFKLNQRKKLVMGDVAFLEWNAHSETADVNDGADSYVIRNGRIVAQTIHYTTQRKLYESGKGTQHPPEKPPEDRLVYS